MRPAIDETFTIVPPPPRAQHGQHVRIIAMAPDDVVRSWRSDVLGCRALERPEEPEAGIVHEHVEAAEALHGGREPRRDAGSSVTSSRKVSDARPGAAAHASSVDGSRAVAPTCHRARHELAVIRPMPDEAPVMSTVRRAASRRGGSRRRDRVPDFIATARHRAVRSPAPRPRRPSR
jgi:hypothetical protein